MPGKFDIQKYKPDAPCQVSLISKNINQMNHGKFDIQRYKPDEPWEV